MTHATATAVLTGKRFKIPPGARGRLVEPGAAARLPCAIVPRDAALERAVKASPLLQLVDARRARVKLERHGKCWFVTDAFHGTHDPDPILAALQPGPARSRARRAGALPRVLAAPPHGRADQRPATQPGAPGAAQPRRRRPAQEGAGPRAAAVTLRRRGDLHVALEATVCFEVHNPTSRALRVTLVNAAASGRVQLLGDQVIDADRSYFFWASGNLGTPFEMVAPASCTTYCVDRLVAIGRIAKGHALDFLQVDQAFEDVLQPTRDARLIRDGKATNAAALDDWAVSSVIIETRP
jgi:hypothetical protein